MSTFPEGYAPRPRPSGLVDLILTGPNGEARLGTWDTEGEAQAAAERDSQRIPGDGITTPDADDLEWARDDLGPDATDSEVTDLAGRRLDNRTPDEIVIVGPDDSDGAPQFWNTDIGWTVWANASRFTPEQRQEAELPAGGRWAELYT